MATTLQAAQVLAWIGQRDALVRQQIAARRTHRGYPRGGNGPAESLLQRMEGWIDARRFNFRNARRLGLLLALMRAELAGDADAIRYARLIKDAVEAAAGRPSIAWAAHQDPRSEPCSLSTLLVAARQRAAAAETSYMTDAKARSVLGIVAAGNAARAASPIAGTRGHHQARAAHRIGQGRRPDGRPTSPTSTPSGPTTSTPSTS